MMKLYDLPRESKLIKIDGSVAEKELGKITGEYLSKQKGHWVFDSGLKRDENGDWIGEIRKIETSLYQEPLNKIP